MRTLLIGTSAILLLLAGSWWAVAQPPTPSVPAPTLSPNLITVSSPTQVLVTVSIPTPTLNPTSVELYRTGANGARTLVAQLNDKGKEGDRKPGDKTFSATLTLYESTPSSFGFQVSATFTGKNNVWGPIQQFASLATTTVPVILPPDPGELGKSTLQGVDSDADGVRDDIQRYIIFTRPDSEKSRAGLAQLAKALQQLVLSTNAESSLYSALSSIEGKRCLYSILGDGITGIRFRHDLEAELLNTPNRSAAFVAADNRLAGHTFEEATADGTSYCKFNPTNMGN